MLLKGKIHLTPRHLRRAIRRRHSEPRWENTNGPLPPAMRLIHTHTFELSEFLGGDIPDYAILSHTWEDGEVTFQDWKDLDTARKKRGFFKIEMACEQARDDGLDFLWVDTNCIDKTSSAELSEAINSMFSWYQQATICYAYLVDVISRPQPSRPSYWEMFRSSRWFTRGWTLQELLAPSRVVFYSHGWSRIGTREELSQAISKATRIDEAYIQGKGVQYASIAQKMSWLSRRITTRVEDMAYCMLGIFDISMPLLYGEGSRAFTRLQEEIIRTSNDHTIFCWTWYSKIPSGWVSLLAPSPQAFRDSGQFISVESDTAGTLTFQMTNAGLSINLPVIQTWSYYLAILNARTTNPGCERSQSFACVPIQKFLDRDRTGRRGVMRRLSFPPGPLFVPYRWLLCKSQLYIRSNPAPTAQVHPGFSDRLPQRFRYSFVLIFDHPDKLLDDHCLSSKGINSDPVGGTCLAERTDGCRVVVETFPLDAFRPTESVILLDGRNTKQGALLRLGSHNLSPVLFLGVDFDSHLGRPSQFGHVFPDHMFTDCKLGSIGPQFLNVLLRSWTEPWRGGDFHWADGIGLVLGDQVLTSAGFICPVYITGQRDHADYT